VTSASIAVRTGPDLESIEEAASLVMKEVLAKEESPSFKVETTRSFKGFPMTSMELSAHLGERILKEFKNLKVRMKEPEVLLNVEVRSEEVLLSALHKKGAGGLPVGSTGKVVVLLSGGIDSPVAAYMAMKRGARAIFINYHSYPFIPHTSLDKIKSLVKAFSPYQGRSLLYVIPFSEIQVTIKKNCPEELRTVLYRRMMMRLAEKAAEEAGALALVTGECLGQVASQTLENIGCINEATRLPVLRPLIGFDKVETVRIAEEIGTYPISIQPFPDSCTVFKPRRPKIRANLKMVCAAEERLDVAGLVEEGFRYADRITLPEP
jgi:thiamine biosynthesis protein ThiI